MMDDAGEGRALWDRYRRLSRRGRDPCADANAIAAFVEDPGSAPEVERHLADCPDCLATVMTLRAPVYRTAEGRARIQRGWSRTGPEGAVAAQGIVRSEAVGSTGPQFLRSGTESEGVPARPLRLKAAAVGLGLAAAGLVVAMLGFRLGEQTCWGDPQDTWADELWEDRP